MVDTKPTLVGRVARYTAVFDLQMTSIRKGDVSLAGCAQIVVARSHGIISLSEAVQVLCERVELDLEAGKLTKRAARRIKAS